MLAIEDHGSREGYSLPTHQHNGLRRISGAVLNFATRALDAVAEVVLPGAPQEYTSEHFGHAEKRNDPYPPIDLSRAR